MNQETNKMQCAEVFCTPASGKRTYVPPSLAIYSVDAEHLLFTGSGYHETVQPGGILGDDDDDTANSGGGSHNPFEHGGYLGDDE